MDKGTSFICTITQRIKNLMVILLVVGTILGMLNSRLLISTPSDPILMASDPGKGQPAVTQLLEQVEDLRGNEKRITCPNVIRTNHIKKMCSLMKGSHNANPDDPETYSRLMLDEKHKLIYCVTPKAGCTSWKTLLKMATGNPKADGVFVHDLWSMRRVLGLTMMKHLPIRNIKRKLHSEEYLKFVIVRHPFERLWSAFKDKLSAAMRDKNYGPDVHEHIMRAGRRNLTESYTYVKTDAPSLEDFVNFLPTGRPKVKYTNDIHWRRQVDLCHPCIINYDHVLRIDTMAEDAPPVFERLAADLAKHKISNIPMLNPTSSQGFVLKEFAELPSTLQTKMFERYHEDFAIYGYSWNLRGEPLCNITYNGRSCC